jgi:molybdopterin synthase sulfur carrier subunit
MKIKVKFCLDFRELFGVSEKEIDTDEGINVEDLLNLICNSYRCRKKIFDEPNKINSQVRILINGHSIRGSDGLHTGIKQGDVVTIFPPAVGG